MRCYSRGVRSVKQITDLSALKNLIRPLIIVSIDVDILKIRRNTRYEDGNFSFKPKSEVRSQKSERIVTNQNGFDFCNCFRSEAIISFGKKNNKSDFLRINAGREVFYWETAGGRIHFID